MASALVDVNRLPLRRNAGVSVWLVRSASIPWTVLLIVESVTEIAVPVESMPSAFVERIALRETTRPKLELANVELWPLVMSMPVTAYRTAPLTIVPFAPAPARRMPPQSVVEAALHPGSRADGHASTPALLSARLVKIFWLAEPVSS